MGEAFLHGLSGTAIEAIAVNSSRPHPRQRALQRAATGVLASSSRPRAVLATAIGAVVALTLIGFALRSHPIDLRLAESLNRLHANGLGAVTSLVYHLFSPGPAIALTAVVTAVIWVASRDVRVAVAFAGVIALTWLPSDAIKDLVRRPRPNAALMPHPFLPVQPDPSFPSGHTVFVTSLVIALFFVVRRTRWRPVVAVGGTLLVVLVAAALMIDAVHYPSDVLASIGWAAAVAPAARLVWAVWLMPRIPLFRQREMQTAHPDPVRSQ